MERVPYAALVERIGKVAARTGAKLVEIARADGYPIYHLQFRGPETAPRFLLSTGIHGEEPGGTMGLLTWLEAAPDRWFEHFRVECFPCLNPHGYERGVRYDAEGRDLNRCFRMDPAPPMVEAVRRTLHGRHLAMTVDMHEDCDYYGFYVYENLPGDRPAIAPRLVERMRREGPVSNGEEGDEPPVVDGIVRFPERDDVPLEEWAKTRELWPLPFFLYPLCDHVITVETPGLQPLELRARMQRAAVDEAFEFTRQRLAGTPQKR